MTEHVVDARWLPPPEPLELTLAALNALGDGDRLRLLIHREPFMLYPILDEWRYGYQTLAKDDGSYEILIWYKGPAATGSDKAAS
jgi:tRNA 2-thiouridine synthesizing protein A